MTNPLTGHEFGAPWTIDDLADVVDDGNRYEIFDGSLLVSPPPDFSHCTIASDLDHLLVQALPAHLRVVSSGVGIYGQNRRSYYVPDVTVFQRSAVPPDGRSLDPADVLLVVEVLSPSNAKSDLVLKRYEYAAAGIPRYWIVDREARTLTVLELDPTGRSYKEAAVVRAGERYETEDPFPVTIDPAEIF